MSERRTMPRWPINQQAELTVENGVKPIECVVEDINSSGMRIALNRNLFDDIFSNFKLAFLDLDFNAGASVAWHEQAYEKNIYGLSFSRIDDSARNSIEDYIQKKFPDFSVQRWWGGLR